MKYKYQYLKILMSLNPNFDDSNKSNRSSNIYNRKEFSKLHQNTHYIKI